MRRIALCTLLAAALAAAPRVDKVEPPNWWTPHTYGPVQVLLTGSDLNSATVTTAAPGFKIEVRTGSADGGYLFVYLTIGNNARPGVHRFQVKNASGIGEFTFRLDRPLDPKGRYQGFTPDDVIYLIMPDRFANGDTSNDGAVDRQSPRAYHGGDLRGLRDRLPYLKDLGVTGVWLTPVYRNTAPGGIGAYHGYSTVDFYDVEPRFGAMAEFKEFVDAAHQAGIKVVQDQVANHSGPTHPFVARPPAPGWYNYADRTPKPRNNFDIASLADPYARPKRRDSPLHGWFAGRLADFNQDNPLVADYLIQNAIWWIGMTGLDAVRQDTYPYVDRPFWQRYQAAINRQFPGFVVTGEITAPNPAALSFFQGGVKHDGLDTQLPSMLDFPLERAVRDVFAHGQPMTKLAEILAQDSLYLRAEMLVVFPGNHDQPRFLTQAQGDIRKLMMAVAFVLTTRRVVHLYYGDEIAMQGGNDPDNRRDFPVESFAAAGRTGDRATVFEWTRSLVHFRREHIALRRGSMVHLVVNEEQYAALRSSPEEHVLVVLNRAGADKPLVLEVDDLPVADGTRFRPFQVGRPELSVTGGKLTLARPGEVEIYWARRGR